LEVGEDSFISQKQLGESKIKFEYKRKLLDLIGTTFAHEYG